MKNTLGLTREDILKLSFIERFELQLKENVEKHGWIEIPEGSEEWKRLEEHCRKTREEEENEKP